MVARNVFFNLLAGSAWVGVVILLDTHRREKKSQVMLLKFFLFGFLSLIPTTILYILSYSFWGNFLEDGWLFAFIEEMFITGPVEEFSKFIVFLLLSRKMKSIKEPVDGVLQAGTVALAFATAENFFYARTYGLGILPYRTALATSGHLFYAAIWGYIYGAIVYESAGRKLKSEYRAIFAAVLPAAILHGLYNFMLDLGSFGASVLVDVVALVLAVAIYRFLRKISPYNPMKGQTPRRAMAELTAALRYNPGSPLLNQRVALLHLYYRDFSKALSHVRTCRKSRPESPYFQCMEAVVRVLDGKIQNGAELMEKAYPRLSQDSRRALVRNIRRVVSRSDPSLPGPFAFGPEHSLTARFFEKITGLRAPAATRSYRRVQLTQRRYLAKAG
jgi:RsiW-degrading membrane proteinase PrsW (M82 family)